MKQGFGIELATIFSLTLLIFSLNAQEYQWIERAPMPTARCGMASATVDGKIYVIGGIISRADTALKVVEVYDPAANTWDSRADAPVPITGAGTSSLNGKIYIFGGTAGWNTPVQYNTIYEYDPDNDTWELVGDFPFPLISNWGMAAVTLGEEVYCIGGAIDLNAHPFNISYHPGFGDWDDHAHLIPSRWGATAVAVDNKIYLMGGTDYPAMFANLELYDPVEDNWTELSPMPEPRLFHNSVFYNDKIYVMPAAKSNPVSGVVTDTMFIYDIDMNEWTTHFNPLPDKVTMAELRVALDEDNKESIFLIGGATLDWWQDTGGPVITNAVWKFEEGTAGTGDVDPDESLVLRAYPNPVSDHLYLRYRIPSHANIRLSLHDLDGRQILMVADEIISRGDHVAELDARDLAPGTYVCSLQWKDKVVTQKVIKVQ